MTTSHLPYVRISLRPFPIHASRGSGSKCRVSWHVPPCRQLARRCLGRIIRELGQHSQYKEQAMAWTGWGLNPSGRKRFFLFSDWL
jgi:hypothetical protein